MIIFSLSHTSSQWSHFDSTLPILWVKYLSLPISKLHMKAPGGGHMSGSQRLRLHPDSTQNTGWHSLSSCSALTVTPPLCPHMPLMWRDSSILQGSLAFRWLRGCLITCLLLSHFLHSLFTFTAPDRVIHSTVWRHGKSTFRIMWLDIYRIYCLGTSSIWVLSFGRDPATPVVSVPYEHHRNIEWPFTTLTTV